MRSAAFTALHLSTQEVRIRHFHRTLMRYALPLQLHAAQPQRVADHRHRAEGHRGGGDHRAEQEPKNGYSTPAATGTPSVL